MMKMNMHEILHMSTKDLNAKKGDVKAVLLQEGPKLVDAFFRLLIDRNNYKAVAESKTPIVDGYDKEAKKS
jgi:hypothetical protein